MSSSIQQTIRNCMRGYPVGEPSIFDLDKFARMIQTGEATWDDFRAVGGDELEIAVVAAVQKLDD